MPTTPIFKLNGLNIEPPRDWTDFSVLATFDKSSVQANITTTDLTFVNSGRNKIVEWFEAGLNPLSTVSGCYQGMPIDIGLSDGVTNTPSFNGLIDFSDNFEILNSVEVSCKLKSFDGLNLLEEQLNGLTFALLEDKGFIKDGDWVNVPYFVETDYSAVENALFILMIYNIIKESSYLIMGLVNAVSVSYAGLGGPLSSVTQGVALVVYIISITFQIILIVKRLKDLIYPTKRHYNGILYITAIQKICAYFGLQFESSIEELNSLVFLPSQTEKGKMNFDSSISGSPTSRDDGYIAGRFMEITKEIFKAKFVLSDNVLTLEPLINDDFWQKQPDPYVLPDVLIENRKYNIEELNSAYIISFTEDLNDTFTNTNFNGTVYEIRTGQRGSFSGSANINTPNRGSLIKGINDFTIPYALGTRRDKLTALESTFAGLINFYSEIPKFFNKVASLFGSNRRPRNIPNPVGIRKDMLKISQHNFSVAKIMLMKKGVNNQYVFKRSYRDDWNAKFLWNKYHVNDSFVDLNYRNQWRLHNNIEVGFGFEDFVKLSKNAYFYTNDGKLARAEKFEWNYANNRAIIDFRVREVFTKNLEERKYES